MTTESLEKFTLREAREKLGISPRELSEKADIASSVIYRIESGTHMYSTRVETAALLAGALQLQVSQIKWPNGLSTTGRPPQTGSPIKHSSRTGDIMTSTGRAICPVCTFELPLTKVCGNCE